MAAGDFTASELGAITLKAEQVWRDSALFQQRTTQAEAARAVLENQTATFREFDDYKKDKKVVVTWLDTCDLDVDDCTTNCDIVEDELESKSQELEPTICKRAGFSVDETKIRKGSYEMTEQYAVGLAVSIKKLDEYWARTVIANLKTFAGTNVYPNPWTFDAGDNVTLIPEDEYNLQMYAHLLIQAQMNQLGNPYFIENGMLSADIINAQLNAGNLDGKGDLNRLNQINMYNDLINFGRAGVSEKLFAIGAGAVAMKTINKHPDRPLDLRGNVNKTIYRVNSRTLPGVQYDVHYQFSCDTVEGETHYKHNWRLETHGGIWLNPDACEVTVGDATGKPTGVLMYDTVVPSNGGNDEEE